jgi:NAD(P)H dehydrogenase (quinone)
MRCACSSGATSLTKSRLTKSRLNRSPADTMTTAVIGATGRVGSEIVRGLLERGDMVAALVRDPGKARRAFGDPGGLHIRPTRLDDPYDLAEAFAGIRTVFIAMGSVGIEGVLQRIVINAAAGISSIEQVTRLSVFNTSADSLGINQRAHHSIDQFAASTTVPYSTIRPAIFSASLLAAAHEVRASRTWTGLAGTGRAALIDHRDVAEAGLRVLTDPALWGAHHDLTGPVPLSWPDALELLSAELGEHVSFRVAAERQFLEGLIGAGVPAGTAELLITREWAILAGENDRTTGTFQQITGHPPRPVAEFLHEYRAEFA